MKVRCRCTCSGRGYRTPVCCNGCTGGVMGGRQGLMCHLQTFSPSNLQCSAYSIQTSRQAAGAPTPQALLQFVKTNHAMSCDLQEFPLSVRCFAGVSEKTCRRHTCCCVRRPCPSCQALVAPVCEMSWSRVCTPGDRGVCNTQCSACFSRTCYGQDLLYN